MTTKTKSNLAANAKLIAIVGLIAGTVTFAVTFFGGTAKAEGLRAKRELKKKAKQ